MILIDWFDRVNRLSACGLTWLQSPMALALRLYVSWQFFKSGLIKLNSWDQTLWLFENEYHAPLLSPKVAALLGTGGELVFPVLISLGLFSRLGALGLFAVNAVAVVSYSQFLFAKGSEMALGQHVVWGLMLLTIAAYGAGRISLDCVIERWRGGGTPRDRQSP